MNVVQHHTGVVKWACKLAGSLMHLGPHNMDTDCSEHC